jgi:hypothetical protein
LISLDGSKQIKIITVPIYISDFMKFQEISESEAKLISWEAFKFTSINDIILIKPFYSHSREGARQIIIQSLQNRINFAEMTPELDTPSRSPVIKSRIK